MCSQYSLHIPIATLASLFFATLDETYLNSSNEANLKILPYSKAPVLVMRRNTKYLKEMQYSLVPHWSKVSKPKFATYNARLETIDEKASFKVPFSKRHCVVPMTGFIEAIYTEKLAGNMVEFYPKELKPLFAAGIWDYWKNSSKNEEVFSFSIITHEPSKYLLEMGHDRSPVFLNSENAMKWLSLENVESKNLKDFLILSRIDPELDARIERPMREGWKKRI